MPPEPAQAFAPSPTDSPQASTADATPPEYAAGHPLSEVCTATPSLPPSARPSLFVPPTYLPASALLSTRGYPRLCRFYRNRVCLQSRPDRTVQLNLRLLIRRHRCHQRRLRHRQVALRRQSLKV